MTEKYDGSTLAAIDNLIRTRQIKGTPENQLSGVHGHNG